MDKKKKQITVVQGNDLLEGAYKISIDEFRLLNLALLKIDSMGSQPCTPYLITAEDFQAAYGINPKHTHIKLKEAARSLMRKPITLYSYSEKRKRVIGTERPWFSLVEYDAEESASSAVNIYFSEFVRPYLYELKKNFTSVTFQYLAALDTPFAIRLYYWLAKGKKLRSNRSGDAITTTLSIDWMKERAGLKGKYSEYKDFRRKVIDPAVQRINQSTDISVMYEPQYSGKYITDLKFIYVDEKTNSLGKPKRERLPRRPHVKAGTDAEGVWARKCISIMTAYEMDLLNHSGQPLPVLEMKKLVNWYQIIGDKVSAKDVQKEIDNRSKKAK